MTKQRIASPEDAGEAAMGPSETFVIEPPSGWRAVEWAELWRYRDLLTYMVWRDVKTRYAQSVLGIGWAVIQPLFTMLVFTIVFGGLAELESDGVPYALFSFAALVPWTFFASALTAASGSLTSAAGMLTKVYFPRLILPMAPVVGKLVDMFVAMFILVLLMAMYGLLPTPWIVVLPVPIFIAFLAALGLGLWLTSLAVQYRDVSYVIGFMVQLLMYSAPVVYSMDLIPAAWRTAYALNPMVGVIETFRAVFLGTREIPWNYLGLGFVSALVLALTGAFYFRRMETRFADVV